MRQLRVVTVLLAGVAYVVIGMGTAILAREASSAAGVKFWRFAAWLLSIGVFVVHFVIERRRHARGLTVAALVAAAVALGGLGVAALGPLRAHWGDPHGFRRAVLSLVLFPIVTGLPAFLVALIGDVVLDRRTRMSGRRA